MEETINEKATDQQTTPSLSDLQDKLDTLWTTHLTLLNQYHRAQSDIQKYMSSGFFMLAQASFRSPSRIRYGQDHYDERTKATRVTSIESDDHDLPYLTIHEAKQSTDKNDQESTTLPTPPATPLPHTDTKAYALPQKSVTKPDTKAPKHPSTNAQDATDEVPLETTAEPEEPEESNTADQMSRKPPVNPLHWYGILVPPPLRNAQSSFTSALQDHIAVAANASNAMRRIEQQIRRLRKDIRKVERTSLV